MIFGGGGAGDMPMPQTPTEWVAFGVALVIIVWVIRTWLDQD